MNKSNSPYKIKFSIENVSLEKSIKVLNLLDLNKTDIVKDVFIIPTDDLQKKKHLVEKKC